MSSDSAPTAPSATDQSRAVSQLEEQNDRQDAEIEAINNSSGIDRFLASANPFSATGYIAQINRNNRNNMIEAISQGGTPIFDPTTNQIKGVSTPVKGLFGLDQIEYVGDPDYNPNAGYDPNLGNVGGNYGQVLGSMDTPTIGDIVGVPTFNPSMTGGRDDNVPMSEIDQARSARSNALAQKQSELANAFASFDDDYFADLGRSYQDFNNPLLSTAYDDAVRGIYDGFKSAGILSQADLDAQMASLDAQRGIESQRLADSANTYAMDQRSQVDAERKKLSDQLSALSGGATNVDAVNQQTKAIQDFDIAGRVEKLRNPNTKTSMDFFSDFNKVPQTATADPVATFVGGTPSPVTQSMFNQTNPYASLGIQTPYQGSATKVIS